MEELVFASDSGASFLGPASLVLVALGAIAAIVLWRRSERGHHPHQWSVGVIFVALGAALAFLVYRDANRIAFGDGRIELRYAWPRPPTEIPLGAIREARIEYKGNRKHIPRLVIETTDGATYGSEGSREPARVKTILARIETLRRSSGSP